MQSTQLHVLLIEDDADDAKNTRSALSASDDPTYRVDQVASLSDAAGRLGDTPYDAVLLELGLPEASGVDAVAKFRALCPFPPPLIVLTSHDCERVALEAIDQGAQEYIIKSDINCLSRAIRHAISRQQMVAELNSANELLQLKNARLAELYDTAQQFVDNVSHEFRTPLTVIREFTSIVRDGVDGPVTPKQIEHLDKVLNRTDDLALMIDDMLDISKLESGGLGVWRRPSQVSEMIASVMGSLRAKAESQYSSYEPAFERPATGVLRRREGTARTSQSRRQCDQVHSGGRPRRDLGSTRGRPRRRRRRRYRLGPWHLSGKPGSRLRTVQTT